VTGGASRGRNGGDRPGTPSVVPFDPEEDAVSDEEQAGRDPVRSNPEHEPGLGSGAAGAPEGGVRGEDDDDAERSRSGSGDEGQDAGSPGFAGPAA